MKTECYKCKKIFDDINYNPDLPLAKRIYCNECVNELEEDEK